MVEVNGKSCKVRHSRLDPIIVRRVQAQMPPSDSEDENNEELEYDGEDDADADAEDDTLDADADAVADDVTEDGDEVCFLSCLFLRPPLYLL